MQNRTTFADYIFYRQRWIVHIFFWLTITVLYVVFFGRRNSNYAQTFFFVGLLMPITIATTYFLNYYLLPRYLMRGRYGFFFLYFIYTLVGAMFLEMMIAALTFLIMAEANVRDMSPESLDFFFMLTTLLVVVLGGVAIKLLLHWRQTAEDHQKLMAEKIAAELRFLKGQLNPHFLFNTLNNLYYLTSEKSERAPQAVIQLSEILDYVMRSGKQLSVPLEQELKQVGNYLALEILRYDERVKVSFNTTGDPANHTIGPMLIVTLIENAFKHGVMNSARRSWIDISVKCGNSTLQISVRNSIGTITNGQGIGLENLKDQLKYLYPGKHEFHVSRQQDEAFSAQLVLSK